MESDKMKLYSFWGSSCSFGVRFGLNLKGLEYDYIAVNLAKGEQRLPEFLKLNPLGYVPVLVDGDTVIADSIAMLMYLEERYPENPFLPKDLQKRAVNYQAANIVCASIQPCQNMAAAGYIEQKLGAEKKLEWVQGHIRKGFAALEKLLGKHAGIYATGDEICLADIYLAPQIDAAVKRFSIDMIIEFHQFFSLANEFHLLCKINEAYKDMPAFQDATPAKQPDAPDIKSINKLLEN